MILFETVKPGNAMQVMFLVLNILSIFKCIYCKTKDRVAIVKVAININVSFSESFNVINFENIPGIGVYLPRI